MRIMASESFSHQQTPFHAPFKPGETKEAAGLHPSLPKEATHTINGVPFLVAPAIAADTNKPTILYRKSLCSRCKFGVGKGYRCKHPKRQTDKSHVIRLWKCGLFEKVRPQSDAATHLFSRKSWTKNAETPRPLLRHAGRLCCAKIKKNPP